MVKDNVEKIRKAKGVSKTHIANKLNLTLQGYAHIENGSSRLDVERLKLISEILGVEPAVFFDDKLTESVINQFDVSA